MITTHDGDRTPVLLLSSPPPDAVPFARYRAAIGEVMEAHAGAGAILVSAHWLQPGGSPNPLLQLGAAGREVTNAAVILAERVSSRLESAGLGCDLAQGGSRAWPAALAGFATSGPPVLHLSVPVNFGPDLMILVGVALSPLREERVLLAACGACVDEVPRFEGGALRLARAKAWARGMAPARFRDAYPLLFMMGASREDDRLTDVCAVQAARVVSFGAPLRAEDHEVIEPDGTSSRLTPSPFAG